jgi:hypothetical protein
MWPATPGTQDAGYNAGDIQRAALPEWATVSDTPAALSARQSSGVGAALLVARAACAKLILQCYLDIGW